MNRKPYVVSADIQILLQEWANTAGFILPQANYFNELRNNFSKFMLQIFSDYELIPEQDLISGIANLVNEFRTLVVSFDKVYFQGDFNFELTRLVDQEGNDIGLGPRFGFSSIEDQISEIVTQGIKKVILVDDVVFSGGFISSIINRLFQSNVMVECVCIGIGIDQGIKRIESMNIPIKCYRRYTDVVDEVCERDFFLGVPLSGKLIDGSDNIGIPYILPFGKLGEWASIPEEWQIRFSEFVISQTVELFQAIEDASNRIVRCCDLGRQVYQLPKDEMRFLDILEKIYLSSIHR